MWEWVKDQLSPILYILEKWLKILKIPVSILSFVDNRLLIAQSKSLSILNDFLFCSYRITSLLLEKFRPILEHGKIEVFHFSRITGTFDLLSLDLSILGGPILWPKNTWRYLEFYFDRKLSFHHHIDFYTNKVISTIKYLKILGNSTWGLISHQKQLLYRSYVLPIALYGFQLWHYNKALLLYPLKTLNKM